MKKVWIFSLLALLVALPVWAQSETDLSEAVNEWASSQEGGAEKEEKQEDEEPWAPAELIPVIQVPDQVQVDEIFRADASDSRMLPPSEGRASYSWIIDDRVQKVYGRVLKASFDKPGVHTLQLHIKQGQERKSIRKNIVAYDRQGVLISDVSTEESLSLFHRNAAQKGIALKRIELENQSDSLSAEESIRQKLSENRAFIGESSLVIFYTKRSVGLQSFLHFYQNLSEENQFSLDGKLLVQLSDGKLDQIARISNPLRKSLGAASLILARQESLDTIIDSVDLAEIESELESYGHEFQILDEHTITTRWPLSRMLEYFVINGISMDVIYILLAVPFLTFVISFFRQFVGVSTFGVYAPLMLSLSFLVLGLQFGMMVFLVVMLVSYMIRSIFERVDILYVPKISLLLSFLSLSFFFVLAMAIYLDTSLNLVLAIFPMMVMSTISEKFLASQSSEGMKNALINTAETVLVSLVAFWTIEWDMLQEMIVARPEWILLPILGNLWLGRFTGLRLSEYLKFRSLFREDSQEE